MRRPQLNPPRASVFPLLILLVLSGCGSTSVTFVNATPEEVADAVAASGGWADEFSLFWSGKRIWPEDFSLTMLAGPSTANWTVSHFLLIWDDGRDTVAVEPQTDDWCVVKLRSEIKRHEFLELLPPFWYSRNEARERLVVLRAWRNLLRKNPRVYAIGTGKWQPSKPPEITLRDGAWIAFEGGDMKSVGRLLSTHRFRTRCRSKDRWELQRIRGGHRQCRTGSFNGVEAAVIKQCGDTVVVGLAYRGWRRLRTPSLFISLLDIPDVLDDDYGRERMWLLPEALAVRFDRLRFVSADPFVEKIALPELTDTEDEKWARR